MQGTEAAFQGTLGRDPEFKLVKGGALSMLALAVAVNEGPKAEGAPTTWVRTVLSARRPTTWRQR